MNTVRRRRLTNNCLPVLAAMALVGTSGCRIRTDPRPPELTMPERPRQFSVLIENDEVRLRWSRPQESIDGNRLKDLAGFVIERRTDDTEFVILAEVLTTDRERIRPQTSFKWRDMFPVEGRSFYRVRAFTDDGQTGSISPATPVVVSAAIVENTRKIREAELTAPDQP
jgi:hypothetical protein